MTELTTLQTRDLVIAQITFEPDGSMHVSYHRPEQDSHDNGVITTHTMYVPMGEDYDEELLTVLGAARLLLLDVLDDLPRIDERHRPRREPDEDG